MPLRQEPVDLIAGQHAPRVQRSCNAQDRGRRERRRAAANRASLVYTDAQTRAYERDLAWASKLAMGSHLEIPSSWSRVKRDAALAGTLLPIDRPDADNLLKIACDAMKGIILADDASVVDATVRKRYSDDRRLRIEVREFTYSEVAAVGRAAALAPW